MHNNSAIALSFDIVSDGSEPVEVVAYQTVLLGSEYYSDSEIPPVYPRTRRSIRACDLRSKLQQPSQSLRPGGPTLLAGQIILGPRFRVRGAQFVLRRRLS